MAGTKHDRALAAAYATMEVDEGRCPICSWPLANNAKDGCVVGDCSYRTDNAQERQRLHERRNEINRRAAIIERHMEPETPAGTRESKWEPCQECGKPMFFHGDAWYHVYGEDVMECPVTQLDSKTSPQPAGTAHDRAVIAAQEIKRRAYSSGHGRQPGFRDEAPPFFDQLKATEIIEELLNEGGRVVPAGTAGARQGLGECLCCSAMLHELSEYTKCPKDEDVVEHTKTLLQAADSRCERLTAENQRLREWKESMLANSPDLQEIGRLIGVKWGDSISDKIIPWIKQQLERAALAAPTAEEPGR